MTTIPHTTLNLSGERFRVVYRLTGDETEARRKADDICVEQTIEFPAELIAADDIRGQIIGRLEDLQPDDTGHYMATISYAVETTGLEIPQFLNVLFGNSSIKPGIRIERLLLPPALTAFFRGPRFGRQGLRHILNIPQRPLLCTALKPMGLAAEKLAEYAYQFALGGIDIIKDDHGLANQSFSPFTDRVAACAAAVARANAETGYNTIYMPNITTRADDTLTQARLARDLGAGGLMIAPGLAGFDTMRLLADADDVRLPILAHPAFSGSFVTSPDNGISHYALFGQLMRLAGADGAIYPNYGGRFSFSAAACQDIVAGTAVPMGDLKPSFPAPGGGMSLSRLEEMNQFYGREVIYLIGGDLHRHGPDLAANSRYFRERVAELSA